MYTRTKIHIILLLFGLQSLSTHNLAKIEINNGTEIYEVKELANDTVQFINPKAKKPTLREILYYRVIEKPYVEKKETSEPVDVSLDFDDSVRPFTNSHGFQFLDWSHLENKSKKDGEIDEYEQDHKEDIFPGDESSDNVQNDDIEANNQQYKKELKNSDKDDETYKDDRHNHHEDSLNSKREKRAINYKEIPEAPTLPDLDIQSFPGYIQEMLKKIPHIASENKPTASNQQVQQPLNLAINEPHQNIRRSNEVDNLLNPKFEINLNKIGKSTVLENVHEYINKNKNVEKSLNENSKIRGQLEDMFASAGEFSSPDGRKPRTYGMSLKEGEGETWNDFAKILPTRIDKFRAVDSLFLQLNHERNNDTTMKEYSGENKNNKPASRKIQELAKSLDSAAIEENLRTLSDVPNVQERNNRYSREIRTTNPYRNVPYVSTSQRRVSKDRKIMNPENFEDKSDNIRESVNKDLEKQLKKSFDKIIENFPPFEPIRSTTEFNIIENENDHEPRTYGMNLTGNHGIVWNDLLSSNTRYIVGKGGINTTEENNKATTTNPITEENSESPELNVTVSENNGGSSLSTIDDKIPETTTDNFYLTTEALTTSPNINNDCNKTQVTDNFEKDDDTQHNKSSTIMALSELLKKGEFWDWLTNWTTTYMEILKEHISKLIEDEVTRQLANYNITKLNEDLNLSKESNIKDEDVKQDIHIDEHKDIEENKTNTNSEPNKNQTDSEVVATETISKEDSNNLKSKDNRKDNKKSSENILAQTIYSNSVGNEHVMNMFIFFPSTEVNKTMGAIGSIFNKESNNDTFIHKKPVNISNQQKTPEQNVTIVATSDKDENKNTDNKVTETNTPEAGSEDVTNKDINSEDGNSNDVNTENITETSTDSVPNVVTTISDISVSTSEESLTNTNDTSANITSNANNASCLDGSNLETCENILNSEEIITSEITSEKNTDDNVEITTVESDITDDESSVSDAEDNTEAAR